MRWDKLLCESSVTVSPVLKQNMQLILYCVPIFLKSEMQMLFIVLKPDFSSLKFTMEMCGLVLIFAVTSKFLNTCLHGNVSTGSRYLWGCGYFSNVAAICWASRIISERVIYSSLLFPNLYMTQSFYLYEDMKYFICKSSLLTFCSEKFKIG